jgi:hypothetical protein
VKWAAALLVLSMTAQLCAQTSDIVTHVVVADPQPPPPPVDLTPLWNAIQDLVERQRTYETRLDVLAAQIGPLVGIEPTFDARMSAIEARVTVLESRPPPASAAGAFFGAMADVLTNQVFLGAVGATVVCVVSKKC